MAIIKLFTFVTIKSIFEVGYTYLSCLVAESKKKIQTKMFLSMAESRITYFEYSLI